MKSLIVLVALLGVAQADSFPTSGPCDDADACEKACAANRKGTCYFGGVLVLQLAAVDDTGLPRARKLFDRGCIKGDVEACWQGAKLLAYQEARDKGDGSQARAAFQKVCQKNHARACLQLAGLAIDVAAEKKAAGTPDEKLEKQALAWAMKGAKLLEQKCTKGKMARACEWVADIYAFSSHGIKADAKKARAFYDRRCVIKTGKPCEPDDMPLMPEP